MGDSLAIVVLAAGLGKRMNSPLPKVVHRTSEKPLVHHVLSTAQVLAPSHTVLVVGSGREAVEECVNAGLKSQAYKFQQLSFAVQEKQLGTGDAVKSALSKLSDHRGAVMILYGDVPGIKPSTLQGLLALHHREKATLSLLTLKTDLTTSYGRIKRGADGHIQKIIEAKDCSPEELTITELNTGVMVVEAAFLAPALAELTPANKQGEFYLTDIVERAAKEGQRVSSATTTDAREVQGVNTPAELALVNAALNQRRVEVLIGQGVQFIDPASVWVDPSVSIAPGVLVGPQMQLRGKTSIAEGVTLEGASLIIDSKVEKNATIKLSVRCEGATIGEKVAVGPFANIRPGSVFEEGAKIGNFVETKNAHVGKDSKASHLTYLGDAVIGAHTNIGAGTITCNYDGKNKHTTTIGDDVFIGSNSALVAPVTIEDGATVGAGSVITKPVAKGSLALTRASQIERKNYKRHKK